MPVQQGLNGAQLAAIEQHYDAVAPSSVNPNRDTVAWTQFDVDGQEGIGEQDIQILANRHDGSLERLIEYLKTGADTLSDESIKNSAQNLQNLANEILNKPLNTTLDSAFKTLNQNGAVSRMNWGGLPPQQAFNTAALDLLAKPEVSKDQRTAYHKSLNVVIASVAAQVQGGNASLKPTLDALRELRSKFEAKFPDNANRFEGFDVPALTEQLKSSDPNIQRAAQQQLRSLYSIANEALQEAESKGDQPGAKEAADKARAKLNEIFSSIAGIDPSRLPPELKTAALSVAFNPDPQSDEGQLLARFDKVGGDHKITPADLALMSSQDISDLAGLLKPDAQGNMPLSPETSKQLFHLLASYANDSRNNWHNKGELSTTNQGSPPKALSLSFKGPDGATITIDAPEGPTGWELPTGITSADPPPTFEELIAGAAI